jgi:hypothetical protein
MTDASIERIAPDPRLATDFLTRARQFAGDAAHRDLAPESRQLLLHQAVVSCCDAVLAIEGRRVVGSDGGHRLRIGEVSKLLPGDHWELFERLDDARMTRNRVSYGAIVLAPDWDDAAGDVAELLALAEARLEPLLRGWAG